MPEHDDELLPLLPRANDLAWAAWGSDVPPAAAALAAEAGLPVLVRQAPESLIGSRWRRREKRDDASDHVEVVGFQPADQHGTFAVVFRTVDPEGVEQQFLNGNGEVVTVRVTNLAADPREFCEDYTRAESAEAAEATLARVRRALASVRVEG